MNEFQSFIFGLLMVSCVVGSDSKSSEYILEPISTVEADTLAIDIVESKIFWKGTKMMGLGKHEGEIAIRNGYLLQSNGQLTGGEIIIDMNSISVTDIPATDPIPIRNLTNHLKSADFFDVDKFPFSRFTIVQVMKDESGELDIVGELEIKGISNTISFRATAHKNRFTAIIEIDRFDWDIAYSGSWVDRTLVDREIQLRVEILCN
ncbi:YceI family protein [Algoriphagus chordae]|uniref:Polyisoprenoid-binding protein YceI n=1 Tax=Algoriphagus chordae TaxID=237019 RepID=A0A2W7T3X2_9BACT|nr:YceI family protein [Algoriphagus chordae]PZX57912.1 polyisoprenoid-binding protein YceI [Algoriphagus chordae]